VATALRVALADLELGARWGSTRQQVVALTERCRELRLQAFRDAVDTAIELRQIVMRVQAKPREHFDVWLAHVGTTERTALNYAALARLAQDAPGVIQRWKELGPSKLYEVATLPGAARQKVLEAGAAEKLVRGTDKEFAGIVAPFSPRPRRVTADMWAHPDMGGGARHAHEGPGMDATVKSARLCGISDRGIRERLVADVAALRKALEALALAL